MKNERQRKVFLLFALGEFGFLEPKLFLVFVCYSLEKFLIIDFSVKTQNLSFWSRLILLTIPITSSLCLKRFLKLNIYFLQRIHAVFSYSDCESLRCNYLEVVAEEESHSQCKRRTKGKMGFSSFRLEPYHNASNLKIKKCILL